MSDTDLTPAELAEKVDAALNRLSLDSLERLEAPTGGEIDEAFILVRNLTRELVSRLETAERELDGLRESEAEWQRRGDRTLAAEAERDRYREAFQRERDENDENARIASRYRAVVEVLYDAVIWMSGSPSFSPEGEAHEGWITTREKVHAAMAALDSEVAP